MTRGYLDCEMLNLRASSKRRCQVEHKAVEEILDEV